MKPTKKKPYSKQNRQGEVSVVNAVASIHKMLEEIAPEGKIDCRMTRSKSKVEFEFVHNGVCATFQVKEGGIA